VSGKNNPTINTRKSHAFFQSKGKGKGRWGAKVTQTKGGGLTKRRSLCLEEVGSRGGGAEEKGGKTLIQLRWGITWDEKMRKRKVIAARIRKTKEKTHNRKKNQNFALIKERRGRGETAIQGKEGEENKNVEGRQVSKKLGLCLYDLGGCGGEKGG